MKRVVVIGDGVVGLCAGYSLSQRGFEVALVGKGGGTTSLGNAGMIVPSHFVPLASPGMLKLGMQLALKSGSPFGFSLPPSRDLVRWIRRYLRAANTHHVSQAIPLILAMNLRSRERYLALSEASGQAFGLETRGLLMLCHTQRALDHEAEAADEARALGLGVDVLDAAATQARDPGITLNVAGAVHFLDDAQLDPSAFMRWLQTQALADVERKTGADIRVIREGNAIVEVRTENGNVRGDEFVLATGAWTGEVGRTIGLDLPMMAGKGYGFSLPDPPEMPTICSILTEARVAVTPMLGYLRMTGTMEIGPPTRRMDLARIATMLASIPRYFPRFERLGDFEHAFYAEIGDVWTGHRPVTPDGLPYLGRSAAIPNLVIAAGHGMMGMSLGPATGEYVADLVEGLALELPNAAMLRPDRFA